MIFKKTSIGLEVTNIDEFNLECTFDCGQCFRWDKVEFNRFYGVAFNKKIEITKKENKIILIGINEKEFTDTWVEYLDLNLDYTKVRNELASIHPILRQAANYSEGIRILKQDPWETLCSFIISQNNNIPRIKGIISKLCKNFGNRINKYDFSFPTPDIIAKKKREDLDILRAGFRSKYILDAAQKIYKGEIILKKVNELETNEAKKYLMNIHGVGPKIAECVLLYGFHRLESFPMDVWMKRAMNTLFKGMTPQDFGKYAGIAQQYIFHYSRNHKDIFDKVIF